MLFKYVSNPDFILKDGYIRATQLSALNDPFEATYDKKGLKELARHFDDISGKKIIAYIEEHKHKIGVICFSETKDNLLMWAHYANEHKGALIGFFISTGTMFENLIKPINSSSFMEFGMFTGQCLPIKYRKQPLYKIDKFDRDYSNVTAEGEDRILFEIFQHKSDEWIYEKEHRITLKLEQADKVILDDVTRYKNIKWVNDMLNNKSMLEIDMNKCLEKDINDENKLHIFLERIEDKINRSVYGQLLADLAKNNPNIIYLFKLSNSSICSIAYGNKRDIGNIINYDFPQKIGCFERFTTKIDTNHYTLKFNGLHKE